MTGAPMPLQVPLSSAVVCFQGIFLNDQKGEIASRVWNLQVAAGASREAAAYGAQGHGFLTRLIFTHKKPTFDSIYVFFFFVLFCCPFNFGSFG